MKNKKQRLQIICMTMGMMILFCSYINPGTGSGIVQIIAGWISAIRVKLSGKKDK